MARRTITIPMPTVPVGPAGAAPGNPGLGRALVTLLRVAGFVLMALCGAATLVVIGLDSGIPLLALALLMAIVPVPFYAALALWLDRFEPEPFRLLAFAFLWGATVATFVALIINSVGTAVVAGELGADAAEVYGGSISAPVVEEAAKAAVLFGLLLWRRHEINSVLDGIVYAAMVGLGFAMTENVLYYSRGAMEEGVEGALGTFIVRGLVSPFAHPVFTAATGIGVGLAATARHGGLRVAAPLLGLLCAMGLHSAWNTAAGSGGELFFGVYLLVMVPVFIGVVVTMAVSRARERRVVRAQLARDGLYGMLSPHELEMICSPRLRRRARRSLAQLHGREAGKALHTFQEAATEVAFHRERVARGLAAGDRRAAERGAHLEATAARLHQQLRGATGRTLGRLDAVAAPPPPQFVKRQRRS